MMPQQHTTRIDLNETRHISVEWSVVGYDVRRQQWRLSATAQMWESSAVRSGIRLGRALTPEVTLLVEGTLFEAVLTKLMQDAYELCLAALPQ